MCRVGYICAVMHKIVLIGNIGRDAETKSVNGHVAISFSVAVTEQFAKQGEEKATIWYSCTLWRKEGATGIAQWLKKGQKVYIEGTPSVRTYEKDGETKISNDVRVNEIQLLGASSDGAGKEKTAEAPENAAPVKPANKPRQSSAPAEDDMPF